jgi:hypothetical protein
MLSLDRMLRRVRASTKDIECYNYDHTKTLGGISQHKAQEKLWFAERDDDITSRTEDEDEYYTVRGLVTELGKMQTLHDAFTRSQDDAAKSLLKYLPMDSHIKYVSAGGRRYPVYNCGGARVLEATTMQEVLKMGEAVTLLLDKIHQSGFLVWNIHPRLFYRPDLEEAGQDSFILGPAITVSLTKAQFPEPDKKTGMAPSIIIGSTIPSPFQVLVDMLSSKYEKDEIEYHEFKQKFAHFWGRVLPPEYRHVPDVCQLYHSMMHGSTEYIDTIICKWCRVKEEAARRYIIKDPTHLLKPGLLSTVDWFALGITLDGFMEQVMEKDNNASPPQSLVHMIQKTIYGEHP